MANRDTPIVDCHFHIVDPERFPLPGNCGYTPGPDETGTAEDFAACMDIHKITHGMPGALDSEQRPTQSCILGYAGTIVQF